MSLLARRVRGTFWARAVDEPARWTPPEFPFELLSDLIERGSRISVWEVPSSDDPMLKRIAAALTMGTRGSVGNEIQSVEFRLVPRAEVEALGIEVIPCLGDTFDNEVNPLHRELSALGSRQAISL